MCTFEHLYDCISVAEAPSAEITRTFSPAAIIRSPNGAAYLPVELGENERSAIDDDLLTLPLPQLRLLVKMGYLTTILAELGAGYYDAADPEFPAWMRKVGADEQWEWVPIPAGQMATEQLCLLAAAFGVSSAALDSMFPLPDQKGLVQDQIDRRDKVAAHETLRSLSVHIRLTEQRARLAGLPIDCTPVGQIIYGHHSLKVPDGATVAASRSAPKFPAAMRQREVMQVLWQAKAFDQQHRLSTREVASKANGNDTPNNYKNPVLQLRQAGIIETCGSQWGGCWLTEAGRIMAAEHFGTSQQ